MTDSAIRVDNPHLRARQQAIREVVQVLREKKQTIRKIRGKTSAQPPNLPLQFGSSRRRWYHPDTQTTDMAGNGAGRVVFHPNHPKVLTSQP